LAALLRHPESIAGHCLRAHKTYPTRGQRRPVSRSPHDRASWLTLHHARKNNLKNLTVRFPLGRLVLVTGVSGSGKSTLVRECLLPALTQALRDRKAKHGTRNTEHGTRSSHHPARIAGFDSIQSVYEVDQAPIGRTPRSIPATYVGGFDDIRPP